MTGFNSPVCVYTSSPITMSLIFFKPLDVRTFILGVKQPPPIPTRNPSTPQLHISSADFFVDMLPAIISTLGGKISFSFSTIFFTFIWCPCATSIRIMFTPELTSLSALSISTSLTPIAAIIGMSLISECQSSYITPHSSYMWLLLIYSTTLDTCLHCSSIVINL